MGQALGMCGGGGGGSKPPPQGQEVTVWEAPGKAKKGSKRPKGGKAAPVSEQDLEGDRAFMDLYSRQIGAFGLDAMLKLVKMKVLIVGLRGVGIEVAKNTALAGVHTLSLFDPAPAAIRDLGSNFFLGPGDVGKGRASVCAPKIQELNGNVSVVAVGGAALTEEIVAAHQFVVFTGAGTPRAELSKWNAFCRTRPTPIAFMYCAMSGPAGSVFVDHGPGFILRDPNGKNPLIKIIDKCEEKEDEDGKYTELRYITPDGQPLESLDGGGLVELSEVGGLCSSDLVTAANPTGSLNGAGPVRCTAKPKDPKFSFRISLDGAKAPLAGLSPWTGGGVITEKKEPRAMKFRSLDEVLAAPGGMNDGYGNTGTDSFVMNDMTFSFSEIQIHVAFQAVFDWAEAHGGEHPGAANVAEVIVLAKKHQAILDDAGGIPLNEEIVGNVCRFYGVELQPMCAFFGGLVAQELVKISGKFTPLSQFFNYHAFEALPDEAPDDTAALNCRYDDLIAVYGKRFQEELGDLRIFMVGCGALGCEYVKNFALMGVCCGPNGLLTITDNDTIEVSNLNRQFLFRSENVGQPKSIAATQRATTMNKDIKIDAKKDLVAPHTEHVFNDDFWSGQDLVCNALDNMQARFYVDERCVFFEKPLLESGTMGTGANVDVCIPHKTQSYADGGKADEGGGVPMCTLRNFPHLIDHCIEWARAQFEDLFVSSAQAAEKFLQGPDAFIAKTKAETIQVTDSGRRRTAVANALVALPLLKETLQTGAAATMQDCVRMAFQVFHALFRDKIVDLTTIYPGDHKTDAGDPFWSGHKKFPEAAAYDTANPLHVEFMVSCSNLFASMLNIHPAKGNVETNDPNKRWMAKFRSKAWLQKELKKTSVPEYNKGKVSLEGDTDNTTEADDDDAADAAKVEALLAELSALASSKTKGFEPADFEKDDDDNFHIDFITACSNLRAFNYHIPQAPRHKCKMIAGRIIPAIATTTASVTGLVMMEMFKVLQGKSADKLRNGNYNLGTNTFMMFEANPPVSIKDEVVVNNPDPKQFPDAYTDKGVLKPEYKDPDMMLGFAEWQRKFPNPHTKYDKVWIDGTADMTVRELKDAIDAHYKDAGLHVTMIAGPTLRVQLEKTPDNPTGIGATCASLWNELLPGTKGQLDQKWVPLLRDLTSTNTIDDPVDVSKLQLYAGLSIGLDNEDDEAVDTPPIILKLGEYAFVPYPARPARPHVEWLPAASE